MFYRDQWKLCGEAQLRQVRRPCDRGRRGCVSCAVIGWPWMLPRNGHSRGSRTIVSLASCLVMLVAGCVRPPNPRASAATSRPPHDGAAVASASPIGSAAPSRVTTAGSDALREACAPTRRHIGAALATQFFDDPRYQATAARHFDSLTAENEMKWYAIEPEPGRFAFEAGDRLVAFAEQHAMRVRGHTLVWNRQLAPWVQKLSGSDLREAMLRHVRTTVEHWKGRIAQWDVVNEATDTAGKLRADSPFTALGPNYLADAFRAAHEADPNALLFYNDYDIESPKWPKLEGAFQLVKELKESGVPIHGMGLQMHLDPRSWPDADDMTRVLERFARLGLQIELTEIDVPVGAIPGTLEQKLSAQREWTRGVVKACLSMPACTGMTFWGVTDKHSWLASPAWAPRRGNGPHLALVFDENYQPKPAFRGIVDMLRGK